MMREGSDIVTRNLHYCYQKCIYSAHDRTHTDENNESQWRKINLTSPMAVHSVRSRSVLAELWGKGEASTTVIVRLPSGRHQGKHTNSMHICIYAFFYVTYTLHDNPLIVGTATLFSHWFWGQQNKYISTFQSGNSCDRYNIYYRLDTITHLCILYVLG